MGKITLQTRIGELLKTHPGSAKVLKEFHLDCAGCGGANHETIEMGAMAHGLDPEKIVEALNKSLK